MATIVFRDPTTKRLVQEHEIVRWHASRQTPYQQVDVFESAEFGMTLALGGVVNVTERDEAAYHEMLVHVPLIAHPAPKRVLIIGGGDGGTLREVVRHEGVEEVVMVEIDEIVVELCREHLPRCAAALDHERATVIIGDGLDYVAEAPDESFDVVLIDSTDPVDAAVDLFTPQFYGECHRILKRGGVLVPQSDCVFHYGERVHGIVEALKERFEEVACYLSFVTAYPSGVWTFTYASKGTSPTEGLDLARAEAIAEQLSYYTPALHRAAFVLPKSYQRCIETGEPVGGTPFYKTL